jgi:hypothetical protein
MISHILFNLFSRYNIGSFGFRKILAILITVLIFGLLYLTVRFTGMDIPNYTRNLAMLATVDLAGFLFLMWKRPKEIPKEEEVNEEMATADVAVEVILEKEAVSTPVKIESELKASKILEKEKEIRVTEEEGESKITIKKIEEEIDEAEKL